MPLNAANQACSAPDDAPSAASSARIRKSKLNATIEARTTITRTAIRRNPRRLFVRIRILRIGRQIGPANSALLSLHAAGDQPYMFSPVAATVKSLHFSDASPRAPEPIQRAGSVS